MIKNPKYSDIKAGDIINWPRGGQSTSVSGHTGIVASVEGDNKFTTYEQNGSQGRIFAKYQRTLGKEYRNPTSLVRKK